MEMSNNVEYYSITKFSNNESPCFVAKFDIVKIIEITEDTVVFNFKNSSLNHTKLPLKASIQEFSAFFKPII